MKGGRGWWATVDVERLKQPSQRLNASTENTARQKMESIEKELETKAYIYNILINL